MNAWGILFMALSWGLILTMVVFTFVRVLGRREQINLRDKEEI